MRALLRQPLLHFMAGGALIFALYALAGARAPAPAPRAEEAPRILVTRGQVESLASAFVARQRRPPSEEELASLVAEHVRDEVLVREALALGLDQGDPVIRRQLRLKMEFLAQDAAGGGEPSEAELRALLAQMGDRLGQPGRVTFRHVFLDTARRGAAAEEEAARLLAALRGPGGESLADEAGDRFLPGYDFRDASLPDIDSRFGGGLAAALAEAPVGRWSGPLRSAYGLHLVRVESRSAPHLPAIEQVRPVLRAEWSARRARAAQERFVAALVARYAVSIEGAAPADVAAR